MNTYPRLQRGRFSFKAIAVVTALVASSFVVATATLTTSGDSAFASITGQRPTNTVTANPDSASVTTGGTVDIAVLANDTSANGQSLNPGSLQVISSPAHGTAVVGPNGTVRYTSTSGYTGWDTFQYKIWDTSSPNPVCATGTVTVNVTPAAQTHNGFYTSGGPGTSTAPDAPNGTGLTSFTTTQNTPKAFSLSDLVQTTVRPLDPSKSSQVVAPANGSLTYDATTGKGSYIPKSGYVGSDSFTARLCDTGSPADCYNVKVTITVCAPGNPNPGNPNPGNPNPGNPNPGNPKPGNKVTANPDSASVTSGGTVDIPVLANDTSSNGRALNPSSLQVTGWPSHGTAVVWNGNIRYTSATGYTGWDTFQYKICDTSSPTPVCATGTVTVNVTPAAQTRNGFYTSGGPGTPTAPDGPNGTGVTSLSTSQNTPKAFGLGDLVQTTVRPLDPSKSSQVVAPTNGSLTYDTATGNGAYIPKSGYVGPDSFTLRFCDTGSPADCYNVRVLVTVGGNTVTANPDSASVTSGGSVDVPVSTNDTSASGQPLNPGSVQVTGSPSHGTAVVGSNGTVRYTSTSGYSGSDTFQYKICDTSTPTPACATGTVTVTVASPPPASGGSSGGKSCWVPFFFFFGCWPLISLW